MVSSKIKCFHVLYTATTDTIPNQHKTSIRDRASRGARAIFTNNCRCSFILHFLTANERQELKHGDSSLIISLDRFDFTSIESCAEHSFAFHSTDQYVCCLSFPYPQGPASLSKRMRGNDKIPTRASQAASPIERLSAMDLISPSPNVSN